jgi:ActR/RegA family two-component response regulator/pimeloyl-ACP methyl ester carboxylesterase
MLPHESVSMVERWGVIVDDDPRQAEKLSKVVTKWGLPSKGFTDPDKALQFARQHRGAVVFAMFDVSLGEETGVVYARTFREEQLSHDIVLMTAYRDAISPAISEELRKLGVSIHAKPIDLKSLREKITILCPITSQDAAAPPIQPTVCNTVMPTSKPQTQAKDIGESEAARTGRERVRKVGIGLAVVAGIVIGIALLPRILAIFGSVNPRVPRSHFVGEYGTNKKLIVFVHGVLGDMDNTWLNQDTGAYWPKMMRDDPQFQDFDVFVYGYNSSAFRQASDIEQIAERLAQQLKDRNIFSSYGEIDFVTHSMGGVVTKRMLNSLYTPVEIGKLQRVHCVVYIAVPSSGAGTAVLASWFSRNPQFKSMDPKTAADFLASVETDWARLLRERTASAPLPRSFSAYETVPTYGITVVPELYTSQLSDGTIMPFDYNHADIVKPPDRNSDVYRWVAARIRESSSMQTNDDSKQ